MDAKTGLPMVGASLRLALVGGRPRSVVMGSIPLWIRRQELNYVLRRVLRPLFTYTRDVLVWKAFRQTGPPAFIKQRRVKKLQETFGIPVFVETGTYLGEMVNAVKNRFGEVYSIEIDEHLANKARR